jgi:hypothetical protein
VQQHYQQHLGWRVERADYTPPCAESMGSDSIDSDVWGLVAFQNPNELIAKEGEDGSIATIFEPVNRFV